MAPGASTSAAVVASGAARSGAIPRTEGVAAGAPASVANELSETSSASFEMSSATASASSSTPSSWSKVRDVLVRATASSTLRRKPGRNVSSSVSPSPFSSPPRRCPRHLAAGSTVSWLELLPSSSSSTLSSIKSNHASSSSSAMAVQTGKRRRRLQLLLRGFDSGRAAGPRLGQRRASTPMNKKPLKTAVQIGRSGKKGQIFVCADLNLKHRGRTQGCWGYLQPPVMLCRAHAERAGAGARWLCSKAAPWCTW